MIENHHIRKMNFSAVRRDLGNRFIGQAHTCHPARWQGLDVEKRPEARMVELLNVDISVPLAGIDNLDHWRQDIRPNIPWADNHFLERVCGYPINPGVEWANWPWGNSAKSFLDEGGKFNHNYMERYWPKLAGILGIATKTAAEWKEGMAHDAPNAQPHQGIRAPYGDLEDIVKLLVADPLTRQAYLPIYFPEDTGLGPTARKPCTLGYQFMVREDGPGNPRMHIYYPMRSCDFYQHWADDVYMTIRLGLWILKQCWMLDPTWADVKLGSFSMHATSLHMFINDLNKLKEERRVSAAPHA